MKKVFFIGFLAVSFIMLATVNIVGAQEEAMVMATDPEEWNGDAPESCRPFRFLYYFSVPRRIDTRSIME